MASETGSLRDGTLCTQCGKPAVVQYGDHPLCVDHHLRMQQAGYLAESLIAAQLNHTSDEIAQATGGLVPPIKMVIPRPPFVGDTLTLNNINVSNSTVGAINTGTVQNLDVQITHLASEGQTELASAIKDFTQAVVDSDEMKDSAKNEVAEQLELLTSQVSVSQEARRTGTIRSVLSGLRAAVASAPALILIWDRLQPLFESVLLA